MLQSAFRPHIYQWFSSEAGVKRNLVHLFTIERRPINMPCCWNGHSPGLWWEPGELMPRSYCRGTELAPTSTLKRGWASGFGINCSDHTTASITFSSLIPTLDKSLILGFIIGFITDSWGATKMSGVSAQCRLLYRN